MRISVLGCGWLGFPLAQYLLKEGFEVKGSTTSPEKLLLLKQANIDAYKIKFPHSNSETESSGFWDTDVLILNIPPQRGNDHVERYYPQLIKSVIETAEFHKVSWVIFASSTSVYSETGGLTKEADAKPGHASRHTGEAILKAEEIIQNSAIDSTILRFGGLYGYDRHPVKYLSGKKNLSDAHKPVNLVHQIDCIKVVAAVLNEKAKNTIFNVVSDGHPPRKEFYQSAAQHFGLKLPEFKECSNRNYRIVSNQKLKTELNYEFTYPNPMDHTP